MLQRFTQRLDRLEEAIVPAKCPKAAVVFSNLDGTATHAGENYATEADALAALPPGTVHIVCREVDCRKPVI